MGKEQILDMEEVQSLTEYLRLMIHFDPEALTGMQTSEALLPASPRSRPNRGTLPLRPWMLHVRVSKMESAISSINPFGSSDQWIR